MKTRLIITIVLILNINILLSACENVDAEYMKNSRRQVLNLPASSEIPTLDSTLATDSLSFSVLNNVMEGLYRLGQDGMTPTPGVAESFKIINNGKTYIFYLRPDAKWSNGEIVTAHDFEFAWKRAIDPKTAAGYASIMYGVIKNASEINQGKLSVEKLGVRAINDGTLEVNLEYPIPYFISLTSFATFYPLNKKFLDKTGTRFGTEANYTLYNGPFTLTEWKHEQSFTLRKNSKYWDKKAVKLKAINYSIVKNTSTSVNLYDTNLFDRIGLDAEYVDSFKRSSEFEASLESTVFFLRLNQKDKLLKNRKARQAINMAWDKELFVNTILNNGSIPANFLVPRNFVQHPISKKDFRDLNGDLVKTDKKLARRIWKEALTEVGIKEYTLELLNFDDETARKTGEYLKEELQNTLPGLTIEIKPQPFKQKNELVRNGDYQMSYDGWGPDFLDPISFIDMFVKEGPFNNMNYYNHKFDEYVKLAKGEYLTNIPLRWNALLQAEKILFQDAAIAPMYQRGRALVTRSYVKNVVRHSVGGDLSFKWAYIEN